MSIHATGAALDSLAADAPQFQTNGGDWDEVLAQIAARDEEERVRDDRIVLNMGPVHPSTHGVLRLVLEVEGEHVTDVRVGTGYLHTGIEKNMEFRTFTQGATFVTRMDYVAPFFQEVAWALAVEKALGITDQVPEKASVVRVLLMELNRIASHLIAVARLRNDHRPAHEPRLRASRRPSPRHSRRRGRVHPLHPAQHQARPGRAGKAVHG